MKKILLNLSILTLASNAVQAQQQFQVTYFQIDNTYRVETSNVLPNGKVDYYTTPEGGFLQTSNIANEHGLAILETDLEHLPAFSLHEKYVKHLGEREFLLQDLKATREGEELRLQWQGAASQAESIEYIILKSIDGKQFEPLQTIPALSNQVQQYSITDQYNVKASYRLAVRKNKQQERYLSKVIQIDTDTDPFTVYPTLTQGIVHIDFVNADFKGKYVVVSQTGQAIASGVLNTQFTTIDVSSLSKGTYMIEILIDGGVSKTQKISKQ